MVKKRRKKHVEQSPSRLQVTENPWHVFLMKPKRHYSLEELEL